MGFSSEQIDSLERIQSLKVSGAISNEEFEDLKAKIFEPVAAPSLLTELNTRQATPWPGTVVEPQATPISCAWLVNRTAIDAISRVYEALARLDLPLDASYGDLGAFVNETDSGMTVQTLGRGTATRWDYTRALSINFEQVLGRWEQAGGWTKIEIEAKLGPADGNDRYARKMIPKVKPTIEACLGTELGLEIGPGKTPGPSVGSFDWAGIPASGFDLRGALLDGCGFEAGDFSGADLRCAGLRWAELQGANFASADLSGGVLYRADLGGANFTDANLFTANFIETNLSGANLAGAYALANFNGAKLHGANFFGSDLRMASMENTDLSNCDLRSANLDITSTTPMELERIYVLMEEILGEGDVRNMPLSEWPTYGLESANFTNILWDETTRWPQGFNPPPSR